MPEVPPREALKIDLDLTPKGSLLDLAIELVHMYNIKTGSLMRKLIVNPMFRDIEDDIQCGETSVNDNYRLSLYSDQGL